MFLSGVTFAETMANCKKNGNNISNDLKWEKEIEEQFAALSDCILQILRSDPTVKIENFDKKKGFLKALIALPANSQLRLTQNRNCNSLRKQYFQVLKCKGISPSVL